VSTNRRCDHFRSGDAYWVLSQLPLCSPILTIETAIDGSGILPRAPLLGLTEPILGAQFDD